MRPGSASGSRPSSGRSPTAGTASSACRPGSSRETRVVFVRHAIPGERVVLEITEGTEGDRFWRGDAVEILEPSPDRVPAPCPYAGPGLCGGCDFQHVTLARQRALKADVVREQLSRLAKLEWDVEVETVPGRRRGPALADPPALRQPPRRRPRDAQAPLARPGPGRRPACSRRPSRRTHAAARAAPSRSPTTASGRCTPAPRTPS